MIYTFRTCPFKDHFPEAFVFGKLKLDLEILKKKILEEKPEIILGIAKAKDFTRFETTVINKFNKNKINPDGKTSFALYIPSKIFPKSKNPTHSFCNWTAYKIKEFLKENNLPTKLAFVHVKEQDILLLSKANNIKLSRTFI